MLRHGLGTNIGKIVVAGGVFVGSLCVVSQEERLPSKDDVKLLGIFASAIGVEEKRK